jgi:hypothetical protein
MRIVSVKASYFCSRRSLTVHLVEWADLAVIDIAKARTPEGRDEQVRLARDATHKQGFFYVINHGLDQAIVGYI